jgi:hypothetical protein
MNFRQTAILLGAVLAVGVVLLIITWIPDKTAGDSSLVPQLSGVKPADIDTVEIERTRDGTTARLKMVRSDASKKPPAWEIVEPYRAPADRDAVEAAITAVMKARPASHAELSGNPAVHGLDPPGLKVTLAQGADKSATVNFGNVTIGSGSKAVVFVSTPQRARPMAVPRGELEALFLGDKKGGASAAEIAKWAADYRLRSIFPGDSRALGEDVVSVKLSLPNKKKELALSRTPSGGWKFDAPAGWGDADPEGDGPALNTFTGVNPLLRALTTLAAGSAADFIESPGDLKQYGLNPDNPDLVRAELKTREGQTAVVLIGKTEGSIAPPPAKIAAPPTGKVFVGIEGQPGVVKAGTKDLSGLIPIITDPDPLRDRNLLTVERGKQIDGLDVVLDGQAPDKPTKLRRTSGEWKLYGGPNDPQAADAAAVGRLTDVLLARGAIKGFPALNPADFTKVAVTLFVWVDGFGPPADAKGDPVKKGEPVKIEFGRKDGDTIYVRRTLPGPNGAVSAFALPAVVKVGGGTETADVMAAVTKTRLDLLDPSLPTFGPDAAVKLTVTGQSTYTVEKIDPKDKGPSAEVLWRFVAPEPKGRVADGPKVEGLLQLLGTTRAVTRFVDEQPTEAKLAEYGFAPAPRLKVVVGLLGPERVYEFGKDAPDPAFVYARIGGRAAVFTLPRALFEQLLTPDLRDRLIFRDVPAAKVSTVEVTGWGGVGLKFEKNAAGVWESKDPTPKTFAVDPAKVTAFVDLIARTRVKAFEKGGVKGEYGFGDPQQNLQVKLSWPGGAVAVNVAASPDNGGTYYCWTSYLDQKEPVFTIDGAPFKDYKAGPGGFAKSSK